MLFFVVDLGSVPVELIGLKMGDDGWLRWAACLLSKKEYVRREGKRVMSGESC